MYDVIVVGAGAAGCFTAAVLSEINPDLQIAILEKTRQPLAKVRISGGGRCNVTHNCFEIPKLIQSYPRGATFLRSAFHTFQPENMIDWLEEHGVSVKVEADGRCFPKSNTSQTMINLFLDLLKKHGTPILLEKEVISLSVSPYGSWIIELKGGESLETKKVLFATGGVTKSYSVLEKLGHRFGKTVPSLFTFELAEDWIKTLSGSVAPKAKASLPGTSFAFQGPLLVTHWGVSGPAILKLSAFAAEWLASVDYQALLHVNWPGETKETIKAAILQEKKRSSGKKILLTPLFSLSKNLWASLISHINPDFKEKVWAHLKKEDIELLVSSLFEMPFHIVGKSLNKEEFVTCGGVDLNEVNPKTMESRKAPGLYFAGEVLHIDGITGGFNFQNAWTSGWMAAQAIAKD